jgi:hypothetical protein
MNNTIPLTQLQKCNTVTLWSIYAIIERMYEIADLSLDGKITQTRIDETGQKVQIPFTHKDALEFICDQATYALMEIDLLKGQLEMLINKQEDKAESISLPVVDLGGAQ